MIASKPRIPQKRPSALSIDVGDAGEADIREDEEQGIKLQETIDLLLAAGYFRARIKGLSSFDKVVGGMAWCIEMCNVDLDVNLLFQENLTIGQKIDLTEKLVAVLPKLKCPYIIEPHQIQGLDFIHVFPVVQFLVKLAIEMRKESGDYLRAYSVKQFEKSHSTPEDTALRLVEKQVWDNLDELKKLYKPSRRYRHPAPHKLKEEEIRVQTTLLEYGRHYGLIRSAAITEGDDTPANDAEKTNSEQHQIEALMSSMSVTRDEVRLNASTVGNIVGLQSAEIQEIHAQFANKQAELAKEERSDRKGGIEHHKRMMASLVKQRDTKTDQLRTALEKYKELQTDYKGMQEKLKELQQCQTNMNNQMKEMDAMENEENQSILQRLRSLVAMNENLKRQEQEFRAHCKEELLRLQKNIEEMSSADQGTSEDQERKQLIENQFLSDSQKLQKMRIVLARKNREIATLIRKIDEVPSRAELSQYQRRFVELYNQVAAIHKETKQFYTLYNTLEDTRKYLLREGNLLNSILDNFTEAMASSNTKEQFLSQFAQIVEGIKQTKFKVDKKKQEEKMRRDQLHDQYLDLIEKQRLYFKTVKEFKEECRKNEQLVSKPKEN